jgi:hypothetical protein
MVQRYILGLQTLTDEQLAKADVNMNGNADVSDVILILRSLLGYEAPKAIGTITVSYVDEDGNKLISDTVTKLKAGTDYSVSPADIAFYELDEENLPNNATGVVSVGNTVVTYHYVLGALSTTVHVKMPEGSTVTPNLYVWEENGTNNCGSWPGMAMTDTDGDGWFECTFATSGTYNWIVNDGTNQTADNVGYTGDQWIVMNSDWTYEVVTTTINVKIPDDATWTPYIYTWQTALQTGSADNNPTGGWPGTQMNDFDKDGWYTVNIYCQGENGEYNWIVNDVNGKQTADNTGFTGSLWIVMEDAATVSAVSNEPIVA